MTEKQHTIHPSQQAPYCGRFAPSPSGPLHFGSLVAAIGSFLHAKSHRGKWLVRIEDLDPPRVVPGASDEILRTLAYLGLEWDDEVVYQSQRNTQYQAALMALDKQDLIYTCTCSRKEIADTSVTGEHGPIYPGTCRHKSLRNTQGAQRIRTADTPIQFTDQLAGTVCQALAQEVGDFVVQRADGIYAYQLAVVVDDYEQHITHVVRGLDLLSSTPRQIYLQRCLGYPVLEYVHLPLVFNAAGEKLSKQTKAAPIDLSNAGSALIAALSFLGQNPPAELKQANITDIWQWALSHWHLGQVPHHVAGQTGEMQSYSR